MDQNLQQPTNEQLNSQNNQAAFHNSISEEKKNLSRKRIFWTIFGIDAALLAFLLYEIISLFF